MENIIEQWIGEGKDYTHPEFALWEKGYNKALADLKSRIPELEERIVGALDKDYSQCPIKETCIGYQNAQSDIINLIKS